MRLSNPWRPGAPPQQGAGHATATAADLQHNSAVKVSLVLLAVLVSIYVLHWAAPILIPILVALLVSYALTPVVDWLEKRRLPRTLAAAVLLMGLLGGTGWAAYAFSDDASRLLDSLPQAAEKLGAAVRTMQGQRDSPLNTVQKAATQLERMAEETGGTAPTAARGVQRVVVEKPRFAIKDYVWAGTLGLVTLATQLTAVAMLSFFLLASGDSFRRKLVKLAGPTLTHKRITLETIDQVNSTVRSYLMVQFVTCVLVGLATWLCFWLLGVENAGMWGLAAGLLDLVPYVGGALLAGGSALAAFMQFGSLQMGLVVAGVSVLIHTVESMVLTPWLSSRAGKMNPLAVFVGVLVFGWLWGPWGLLLGLPILMVVKAVCDRVEGFKPVGELLGEDG